MIIGGFLILLLALGFLTFDDWLWGGRGRSGDAIGRVADRSGDVRVKFDGEVKWQKAHVGEKLIYNDTIFAGASSKADLQLGASSLEVSENTLVVLRRQDNAHFLNLNFGKLLGHIAKADKIVIDTGDGKSAVLSSESGSEVVLEKKGGKTEVKVTKGEAELVLQSGKKQVLTTRSRTILEDADRLTVRTVTPKSGEPVYSKQPITQKFEWAYDGKPAVDANDRFAVEFSQTPDFQKIYAVKTVQGKTDLNVNLADSQDLYYRVRGPKNEVSEMEHFQFVRMNPPFIVTPSKDSVYLTNPHESAPLTVEFRDQPGRPQFLMQIASDPDFKNVIVNEEKTELKNQQNLPSGAYYLRASADYGNGRASDWSATVPFQVKDKPILKLTRITGTPTPSMHFSNSAVIKNKEYPEALYSASKEDVQKYLAEREGFLNNYFAPIRSSSDDIVVDTMDGTKPTSTSYNFPAREIYPGSQRYRYQVIKKGHHPSAWSNQQRLTIALEPPRENSFTVDTAKMTADGKAPATVGFTRVLFAKQYEVQMSHQPDFANVKSIKVQKPVISFTAKDGQSYYVRARALDGNGHPISDFSRSEQVDPGPQILQARADREKHRAPAATNTISTTVSSMRTFEHWHGAWAWVGSGINYTSYNQTITNVGNFYSHDIQPIGAYLEVGWGDRIWSGIFSYKNTPGTVQVSNASVNGGKFQWQTISGEAMYCPLQPFTVFGKPANVGLRAGLQYQSMPFATVNSLGTALNVATLNSINASVGATVEWARDRWRYYWTMRYQYPLSASSAGTTITPELAFDGSVGTAYYFTDHWKAGAFWYGQWQEFNFASTLGGTTATGSQMLFFSALDLRLGYDF